jgi:hypothetical protein
MYLLLDSAEFPLTAQRMLHLFEKRKVASDDANSVTAPAAPRVLCARAATHFKHGQPIKFSDMRLAPFSWFQ